MLSADSVQRSGNGRGAFAEVPQRLKLATQASARTESTLLMTFRFRTALANSPAETYTGSVTFSSSQGTSDDSSFADRVELRTADAAFGTLFVDAVSAGHPENTTTCGPRTDGNKVMGCTIRRQRLSDVTNMGLNRLVSIATTTSASSERILQQHSDDQPDQYSGGEFPRWLGLDFYLSDELNGCTAIYNAIKTWARTRTQRTAA